MKKNQYIEISNRGSGKTYRLIKALNKYIEENPKATISVCAPSIRLLKIIEKEVNQKQSKIWFHTPAFTNRGIKFDVSFYVEFSFCEIQLKELIERDNIYACATLSE